MVNIPKLPSTAAAPLDRVTARAKTPAEALRQIRGALESLNGGTLVIHHPKVREALRQLGLERDAAEVLGDLQWLNVTAQGQIKDTEVYVVAGTLCWNGEKPAEVKAWGAPELSGFAFTADGWVVPIFGHQNSGLGGNDALYWNTDEAHLRADALKHVPAPGTVIGRLRALIGGGFRIKD